MCFNKTKQSKVLIAKRDIVVYKIGSYADEDIFKSFFYSYFGYTVNQIVFEKVKFTDTINWGFHSYIMCKLVCFNTVINVYPCRNPIYCSVLPRKVSKAYYLGEFIIPKGATYCLNNNCEAVSNKLMYTGNHIEITSDKIYNSKELWKEN